MDLDNFYNSGEVSGDGWPWSTSGRESDFGEKAVVLHYADRGTNYEYEGLNRDINVGLKTLAERKAANPKTPSDPDLLPGAINVAEPDGPEGSPRGKGYIWDAVLRAGLTFREYGCMSDTTLDAPREPYPFKARSSSLARPIRSSTSTVILIFVASTLVTRTSIAKLNGSASLISTSLTIIFQHSKLFSCL